MVSICRYCGGASRFRETRPGWLLVRGETHWIEAHHPEKIDGALGRFNAASREVARLRGAGIEHLVGFSNRGAPIDLPLRINDDVAIGRMAAEYFLQKAFRNFACIGIENCLFSPQSSHRWHFTWVKRENSHKLRS